MDDPLSIIEDASDRRLAGLLMDHLGSIGWSVALYRIGPDAEGGWELLARNADGIRSIRIDADRFYPAVIELLQLAGVELDDG